MVFGTKDEDREKPVTPEIPKCYICGKVFLPDEKYIHGKMGRYLCLDCRDIWLGGKVQEEPIESRFDILDL